MGLKHQKSRDIIAHLFLSLDYMPDFLQIFEKLTRVDKTVVF